MGRVLNLGNPDLGNTLKERAKNYSIFHNNELRNAYELRITFKKPLALIGGAYSRAKKNNIKYDLNEQWVVDTWNGRCKLSDVPFKYERRANAYSPSIDRIDNSKGYTQDNCRFILFGLNMLKHTCTDDDMYMIASSYMQKEDSIRRQKSQAIN